MRDSLLHYFYGFLPAHQPMMARPSYRRELVASCAFPVGRALIEGGVVGVLAKFLFNVSEFQFATILAAPMFANLTSGLWARLTHGRRKAVFIAGLQSALMLLIASIAWLPTTRAGGGALVLIVILARCLIAGIVTLQSVIWRANYRRDTRAQVTGRFTVITAVVVAAAPLIAYRMLDYNPNLFRVIYPVGAVVGSISVVAMASLRVRRERSLLDYERTEHREPFPDEDPADPFTAKRVGFIEVLRHDHLFRQYMTWQFVAGMANITGNVAVLRLILHVIEDARPANPGSADTAASGFALGTLLTTSLPMIMMTISIPFWARYLDRVHIATFRTRHGFLWIVSQVLYFLVALAPTPLLFIVPRMLQGVIFGGGSLAWQLGHHDFADRKLAATYMGIHQTLTGVRGATAPYLGVFLLAGWTESHIFGLHLPAWSGIGPWVFALTAGLALIAWLGFVRLDRKIRRDGPAAR